MTKRYKVVLDTNVFIHGWFYGDEDCQTILKLVKKRKIYIGFSQDSIGELMYVSKNFARNFIRKEENRLSFMSDISKLFYYGSSANISQIPDIDTIKDKTDLMFVKCAFVYEADFLVSNDYRSGMFDIDGQSFHVVNTSDFLKVYKES